MIHGGLGEAFQWAPILQPLARHRRVLAVDRPGHGLADPFDSRRIDLMAPAAGFIGDVLDAAGMQKAALVGSSMGGLFATAFALAHPERVSGLVLQSPAGITRKLPMMLRAGTLPLLRNVVRNMMRNPTRDSMRSFWRQLLVAHSEHLSDEFLDLSVLSQKRNAESWRHSSHERLERHHRKNKNCGVRGTSFPRRPQCDFQAPQPLLVIPERRSRR